MKFEGKFGILKYLIVCLALICVNKADDFLRHTDNVAETVSEIIPTESNHIKAENFSFSMPEAQCRIPRQTSVANSLRTFAQAHRLNPTNQSRSGFTLTKSGKSTNVDTTLSFLSSIITFPSGMNETNHHLISLRKLII